MLLMVQWSAVVAQESTPNPQPQTTNHVIPSYGAYAEGVHLFPYRTEKLSPSWPMVLLYQAGE